MNLMNRFIAMVFAIVLVTQSASATEVKENKNWETQDVVAVAAGTVFFAFFLGKWVGYKLGRSHHYIEHQALVFDQLRDILSKKLPRFAWRYSDKNTLAENFATIVEEAVNYGTTSGSTR